MCWCKRLSSMPKGDPVLLSQIIEQWQTLFEFFEVLAHGAVLSVLAVLYAVLTMLQKGAI